MGHMAEGCRQRAAQAARKGPRRSKQQAASSVVRAPGSCVLGAHLRDAEGDAMAVGQLQVRAVPRQEGRGELHPAGHRHILNPSGNPETHEQAEVGVDGRNLRPLPDLARDRDTQRRGLQHVGHRCPEDPRAASEPPETHVHVGEGGQEVADKQQAMQPSWEDLVKHVGLVLAPRGANLRPSQQALLPHGSHPLAEDGAAAEATRHLTAPPEGQCGRQQRPKPGLAPRRS
jgi:hypothetical protein